jgi:hypothetical protein
MTYHQESAPIEPGEKKQGRLPLAGSRQEVGVLIFVHSSEAGSTFGMICGQGLHQLQEGKR